MFEDNNLLDSIMGTLTSAASPILHPVSDPDEDEDEDEDEDDTSGSAGNAIPIPGLHGGFVDNKKPIIDDESLKVQKAYTNILEQITNNFYKVDGIKHVSIVLDDKGNNSYDGKTIKLSSGLMEAFHELNLPRFTVYYHELGHHLFTQGMFKLEDNWRRISTGPIAWQDCYHHLMNWIEDFFIEDALLKQYSYLKDVLTCLKKLPIEYDVNRIEYAFNYWYLYATPTSALTYNDQIIFKTYVTQLLNYRSTSPVRFGFSVLSTLSIKKSNETKYVELLIEFYNWCVTKKIFPPNKALPPLSNPNNYIPDAGSGNSTNDGNGNDPASSSSGGSHSAHSGQVGKTNIKECLPITNKTDLFKSELVQENKLINHELLDMSQRVQAEKCTLDGLFNSTYKDSALIQSKVIVPNFFNPNRIVDQILFREKQHSYMNVAIYRDISGSTNGSIHKVMHKVCEHLYSQIPVDITYYLYSSGDISICEVPYIPWEMYSKEPQVYLDNPIFKKFEGGTNSSAIADVITQQLSDKWLNIIVTDGDLVDLMGRDNIQALLNNVFVIYVTDNVTRTLDVPNLVTISSKSNLNIINDGLMKLAI